MQRAAEALKLAEQAVEDAQGAQQAALEALCSGLDNSERQSAMRVQEELKGLQTQLTTLLSREAGEETFTEFKCRVC
jgi:hypothetical protein